MGENGLSAADVAAVTNHTNGYAYPYPPYPYMGGTGFGNGFGNGDWSWILLLILLTGGYGFGGGFGGFGGFGMGMDFMYPWLSNGQKEIMQNTNQGFDTLHLSNQLDSINSGVQGLSTQLCNCCADMNQTVNAGFANAETAANARQIANMQQSFNNQLSTVQGLNDVNSSIASTGCDIREGIAGVNYNNALQTQTLSSLITTENCADRAALQEGIRDLLTNQTANTQRILDQLCNDKIDAKNEKIADLQRQLTMADLKASQIEQNAFIARGFSDEVDQLYNRLSNCPVPSTPVYGRTPIFTCNGNNGCGCGNTFGSTLV